MIEGVIRNTLQLRCRFRVSCGGELGRFYHMFRLRQIIQFRQGNAHIVMDFRRKRLDLRASRPLESFLCESVLSYFSLLCIRKEFLLINRQNLLRSQIRLAGRLDPGFFASGRAGCNKDSEH